MIRLPGWVCIGLFAGGLFFLGASYQPRPGLENAFDWGWLRGWMLIWRSLGFVLLWLFEPRLESLCHRLGGLLLALASFGHVWAEPRGEAFFFPWYGVARSAELRWVVRSELATALGMVTLLAGAALALRVLP